MVEGCLVVSASSGESQAAVHRDHEGLSVPTGALAPDEDQTPGGDPSRGRRGVREDSGNPVPVCQDRSGADRQTDASSADPRGGEAQGAEVPVGTPVSDRAQRNAAAEPVSEAAVRVLAEVAVPDGDAGAAEAAQDEDAGSVPARSRRRPRSTRRHTPRSRKAARPESLPRPEEMFCVS